MPVSEQQLKNILQEKFPNAQIEITDLVGDQDHYSIKIISDMFKGYSVLAQHRMVNEALKELLLKDLHAVTINTITKE